MTETKEIEYPFLPIVDASKPELCPIGLAAFDFHIKPMLEARCMSSCHAPGGNAAASLAFLGQSDIDSQALRSREGGTAEGIFRKASGLSPHAGGAAAQAEDLGRIQKWLAAEELCK
jgi:hypothetical protein